MDKYAVFIDDGFDRVFDDKERAKEYAKKTRENFRIFGIKDSCYVKKLTKDEIDLLGCFEKK